jgi:hypothetical protein
LRRAEAPGVEASIGYVHVRRALLLFAIVLGLAAIAASVSRQPDEPRERAEQPAERQGTEEAAPEPTVSPGNSTPMSGTLELTFDAERDRPRRLDAGQPAAVLVEVDEPGLVEIPDLGRSAHGDPLTPARFDVLVREAGRYEISFTPVDGDTPSPAGTLLVRAADEQ